MVIKVLQLHKRSSYEFKSIQDKYALSVGTNCYALADGTTQSFRSEQWAQLVTNSFIIDPAVDPFLLIPKLVLAAKEFKEQEFKFSANPAYASLEKEKQKKGATATLIGIKFEDERKLSIISCGDSNVFLIRKSSIAGELFLSYEELDANSYFLNTEKLLAGEVENTFFTKKTLALEEGDIVIVATDALCRLLLRFPEYSNDLLQIDDFESLHNFCLQHWESKELEEDDISAIILSGQGNFLKEIIPPPGFCFPQEDEKVFIPTTETEYDQLNEQEMQQLNSSLSQISDEIGKIKRKSRTQETLLMVVIIISFINLLLVFLLRPVLNAPEKAGDNTAQLIQQIQEQKETIQEQKKQIQEFKIKGKEQDDSKDKKEKESGGQGLPIQSSSNKASANNHIKKDSIDPKKTNKKN
jgi:hypothetical protein